MSGIILSLKPVYAQAILSGKKKYEFRRLIFKKAGIRKAYIYVTAPVRKIVGSFLIGKIIEDTPQRVWQRCKRYAGITAEAFFKYYSGCTTAFAITIRNVQNFICPLDPYSRIPNFKPPQSFRYIARGLFSEHRFASTLQKG